MTSFENCFEHRVYIYSLSLHLNETFGSRLTSLMSTNREVVAEWPRHGSSVMEAQIQVLPTITS